MSQSSNGPQTCFCISTRKPEANRSLPHPRFTLCSQSYMQVSNRNPSIDTYGEWLLSRCKYASCVNLVRGQAMEQPKALPCIAGSVFFPTEAKHESHSLGSIRALRNVWGIPYKTTRVPRNKKLAKHFSGVSSRALRTAIILPELVHVLTCFQICFANKVAEPYMGRNPIQT